MKFFKKRWVAWTLCVLAVLGSTLLNTRWKLGAKCEDLTESFYGPEGIAAPLSQRASDAENLARLAQDNGVDAKPLQEAAESLNVLLGQHSEEVLRGLGYSEEELKAMHASGVYQTWDDLKAKHHG